MDSIFVSSKSSTCSAVTVKFVDFSDESATESRNTESSCGMLKFGLSQPSDCVHDNQLTKSSSWVPSVTSFEKDERGYPKWFTIIWNKYSRSLFIGLGTLLSAGGLSNWQPLYQTLNSMGAFRGLCLDQPIVPYALCDRQYKYMACLYCISSNFGNLFSFIAILFLRYQGGRKTVVSGMLMMSIAWMLIIYSEVFRFPVYGLGIFFLAFSEPLIMSPSHSLRDQWPLAADYCTLFTTICHGLSSWVPPMIWIVSDSSESDTNRVISIMLLVLFLPMVLHAVSTTPKVPTKLNTHPSAPMIQASAAAVLGVFGDEEDAASNLLQVSKLLKSLDFALFTAWLSVLTLGLQFYHMKILQVAGKLDCGGLVTMSINVSIAIGIPIFVMLQTSHIYQANIETRWPQRKDTLDFRS
eukprot:GHVH01007687.1.p1 GENE.GHVH01007687.1~~GHVH01007687.1.p1  ORF type:complete len:410 (-),score=36.78 GHVH01007687.1:598-1827(-)